MFTIIVPVYNSKKHVIETLNSIANQSFKEFECLIIDDCSTDGSYQVVIDFCESDSRFKSYQLKENSGGPASPRNYGISKATNQLILFCDSDDLWHEDKLLISRNTIEELNANGLSFSIICCRFKSFRDGKKIEQLNWEIKACHEFETLNRDSFKYRNRIGNSGALVKRSDILAVGGLDQAAEFVAVEDYDLWLKVITHTKNPVIKLKSQLVKYRVIPSSISANKLNMYYKALRVQERHFAHNFNKIQNIWHLLNYLLRSLIERLERILKF